MTFLRYSAQAATDDPGWMQSTVWLNVDGDVLSRRLINEPSSVDLVKTFTADTDSSALVLHLLQTLTYDAVVALQSLHHSNITRHVIAVEEVLRSYSTFLGKECCATHQEESHQLQASQGTLVTNTAPQPSSFRHSLGDVYRETTSEGQPILYDMFGGPDNLSYLLKPPGLSPIPVEGQPDCCDVFGGPNNLAYPFKPPGLSPIQDTGCHQSSNSQISLEPLNVAHSPQALCIPRYPRCSSETFGTDTNERHYLPQAEVSSPEVNATGSGEGFAAHQKTSVLSHTHATGTELGDQVSLLHPAPLPVACIPSLGVTSSPEFNDGYQEDMSRSLWPNRPSWLCAPSPSLLPAPSFLYCNVQPLSSAVASNSLSYEEVSHTLLDDDESTWRGLEHAISNVRNQADIDHQQTGRNEQAIHTPDRLSLSSDSSLDNRTSCSGSSVEQSASLQWQSFRPFSVSPGPEQRSSIPEEKQKISLDVSETGITGVTHLFSGYSGWHPFSPISQVIPGNLYSRRSWLQPLPHVSLTSPSGSLSSSDSSCGTAIFMDEEYSHVQAPRPRRLDSRPTFLGCPIAPPLPLDSLYRLPCDTTLDRYTQLPQLLFNPNHEHILAFVENVFRQLVSTDDTAVEQMTFDRTSMMEALSSVLCSWHESHVSSYGMGASNPVVGRIEFISQNLVTLLRQEFKRIAKVTDDSFATEVAPLLKFVLHLQALPSVAPMALRALGTLVDAVLRTSVETKDSACAMAQRISCLLDYFHSPMKGVVDSSWEDAWQSMRNIALSFIYGKLRSFVRLFIENLSREMYVKESVLFLATLLARLSPRKMLQKVVPIKKLVTLLNATDSATPLAQRQRVKTATTLLLIVCSDAQKPGCIACSRRSTNRPVIHQGQGATACACTAYLELLSYESQLTRSLVSHGHLDEAFECLVEMDAIEKCVSGFPRE